MRERAVVVCAAACLLLVGCGHSYSNRWGSQAIPESFLLNCYHLGYVREAEGQRRPHIAIFWVAHMGGSGTGFGSLAGYTTVGIHGHEIHVPDDEVAAYALKLDYTLRRLPLTEDEVRHLFAVVETEGLMLYADSVWQEKAAPHLSVVECPEWLARQD